MKRLFIQSLKGMLAGYVIIVLVLVLIPFLHFTKTPDSQQYARMTDDISIGLYNIFVYLAGLALALVLTGIVAAWLASRRDSSTDFALKASSLTGFLMAAPPLVIYMVWLFIGGLTRAPWPGESNSPLYKMVEAARTLLVCGPSTMIIIILCMAAVAIGAIIFISIKKSIAGLAKMRKA